MDKLNMTIMEKSALLLVVVYLMFMVRLAAQSKFTDNPRECTTNSQETTTSEPLLTNDSVLEVSLQKYEALTDKMKNGVLDAEAQSKKIYRDVIDPPVRELISTVDKVIQLMDNPNFAYKFLKQKGIERIIIPNLNTSNAELKTQLLELTKLIFDIAPTATTIAMPITVIDQLLEIFDHGDLAQKAHVLDILYVWLPGSPKVQARVIKKKSLEVLYYKIIEMDPGTSMILALDLFNKILVEHIEARKKKRPQTITDKLKLETYRQIGLTERMTTYPSCRGMLNIFEGVWTYKPVTAPVPAPVLELIKNLKPFCPKFYYGKLKQQALRVFKLYLEHVQGLSDNNIIVDKEEMISVLEGYLNSIQPKEEEKDEL